jgi:hypothetical protein
LSTQFEEIANPHCGNRNQAQGKALAAPVQGAPPWHALDSGGSRRNWGRIALVWASRGLLVLCHSLFFGLRHTNPQRQQGTWAALGATTANAAQWVKGSTVIGTDNAAPPCLRCGLGIAEQPEL